ncbi:MAG: UDP-3-O-acyl-N-acetylglucosamine deacetylase, partial [Flavobacteriaceae bacterium]|nr:UDP-3-O-acyl-N-acetylglucosamine deacetylase [Flavobacteriaceae bacterium]
MKTQVKQKTIAKETTLKGVGLHTGKEVSLTFKPAEVNTGFMFCREDLEGSPSIQALAQYVTRTERSTILSDGSIEIHTSEHVLAALTGMDLDNVLICLDSEEPPIMDGSSIHFVNAIEEAGIVEQDAEQEIFEVTEIIEYKDENTGSELILLPHDSYEINVMVDFGSNIIGTQNASITDISQFKDEIADSRTFSFLHEIEMLLDNGLIKGGDLNNAIIYVDKELSD